MAIDVNQLIKNIKAAATGVIEKDVATLRGFAEGQVRAIAQQAAYIAQGIESGEITEETRDYFLGSLEERARHFAQTLRGLEAVAIEKVRNAVIQAIWKFLDLP